MPEGPSAVLWPVTTIGGLETAGGGLLLREGKPLSGASAQRCCPFHMHQNTAATCPARQVALLSLNVSIP